VRAASSTRGTGGTAATGGGTAGTGDQQNPITDPLAGLVAGRLNVLKTQQSPDMSVRGSTVVKPNGSMVDVQELYSGKLAKVNVVGRVTKKNVKAGVVAWTIKLNKKAAKAFKKKKSLKVTIKSDGHAAEGAGQGCGQAGEGHAQAREEAQPLRRRPRPRRLLTEARSRGIPRAVPATAPTLRPRVRPLQMGFDQAQEEGDRRQARSALHEACASHPSGGTRGRG